MRSSAPPPASRTRCCSSRPRSPACAAVSCSRSTGETSTFPGSVIRVRASYAAGQLTTPKSGKVRSVPMAPDVAAALVKLGHRPHYVADDDLVFVGVTGGFLDPSALRRRYDAALGRAGLRRLRFHDLRHTFGTRMIAKADIRRVQEWMGHADIQTTMKYLHYVPRADDARLVAEGFSRPAVTDERHPTDAPGAPAPAS